MRFWDCAISGCEEAAAIDIGGCERCQSMYCALHIDSALHKCEKGHLDDASWRAAQTAELVALKEKTNHAALLRRAKQLAGGRECRLDDQDVLGRSRMGGMHVHLQLVFEDGTVWLVRILRENHTSFDNETSNKMLLSECATLRWLESVKVPTPRLYGYGLRGDDTNEVGVAYMIIDKLPGKPFDRFTASVEQKSKVWRQWAEVLDVLGHHEFNAVGSLEFGEDKETIEVGPVAGERTGSLPFIGPFKNAKDLYSSWADSYLELISDGQLCSAFSTDAYLMLNHFAEQTRRGSWLDKWHAVNSGPFFLKHTDDKGDHILVDDDFQITGIIDWTSARTVPAYEAFGPSLLTADTTSLFTGVTGLSQDDRALSQELKRQKSPHCYFESDEVRRFLFGIGLGMGVEKDEAIKLFQAVVATFEGKKLNWPEWRQAELVKAHNDARLAGLIQRSASPKVFPDATKASGFNGAKVDSFATCSHPNCGRSSVRGRSCQVCEKHLCATHILPQHHKCPSINSLDDAAWERRINDEVQALLDKVNIPELVRVATSLRDGLPCQFLPGKHLGSEAMMGCANYHAWIVFDDGVKWLARIPRTSSFSDIPLDLVDYLVESEFSTLRWLEKIGIPTPEAYGFGVSSDPSNLVGASYILEEAMPGKPFYPHQATAKQTSHVYNQYADILAELSHHSKQTACSLSIRGEDSIASNRFLSLGKYGPFDTSLEYFTKIADLHLDLIADGQLYPEYPKEALVFYTVLRDRAAPVLAIDDSELRRGFFLKHVDDKGDHLLVDDNYNITAVIDWQFARFVPACEAFGPSLFTADLARLYGGSAGSSATDQVVSEALKQIGRQVLSKLAGGSELVRRFQFGLASGMLREEVVGMIGAVLSLLEKKGDMPLEEVEAWVDREWEQASYVELREKISQWK
ncbi:hypothetical protein G7046_g6436 [Stylonectria norvegica]|nr:hypothetical protein G7046_g6436 [Stylonectria norvegica]